MRRLLTAILLLLAFATNAQQMYKTQTQEYEKWLEYRKLSQFFEVYDAELSDGTFVLFLQFRETPPNKELWKELQKQNINDLLYKNMLIIYGQNPTNSFVQIRDGYVQDEPHDFVGIMYDAKNKAVKDTIFSFMRPKAAADPRKLKLLTASGKQKVKWTKSRTNAYKRIVAYMKQKYDNEWEKIDECYFRPKDTDNDSLIIELGGVKSVALSKGKDALCNFISWFSFEKLDCNLQPVEMFRLKVYLKEGKGKDMDELHVTITGRFGSGWYDISDWSKGYDMDKHFSSKIKGFVEEIAGELETELEK